MLQASDEDMGQEKDQVTLHQQDTIKDPKHFQPMKPRNISESN